MTNLLAKKHINIKHLAVILFTVIMLLYPAVDILAGPDAELYDLLERFHGHTCAGSIFGARLGYAAKAAMGDHGKLKAQYSSLSCPVDGIQFTAGTTYGNKALEIIDQDDNKLVLFDIESGKKVEARLTAPAQAKGQRFREISSSLRAIGPETKEAIALGQEKESILDWLKTAPDSQVVHVQVFE